MGSGYAHRCHVCDDLPLWSFVRRGDVVVSWACAEHTNEVALLLQRDHEITELVMKHFPKAVEVADIDRSLNEIANEGRNRHYCGAFYDGEPNYCPECHMPTRHHSL